MTDYWLGIDQGTTKTSVALLDGGGTVLHEACLSTRFNRQTPVNMDAVFVDRLQHLLEGVPLLPRRAEVRVVGTLNALIDERQVRQAFKKMGAKVAAVEQATDSLGQYGLSQMQGRTLTYCTGSYYVGSYHDQRHHMHLLKWPYSTATVWGSRLCAARYGAMLLDAYALHSLDGQKTALTETVEQMLGKRGRRSIYAYLHDARVKHAAGRVMQLAPYIGNFMHLPEIRKPVQEAVKQAVSFLELLMDDVGDYAPRSLVVAGSPLVGQPKILAQLKKQWTHCPIEVVEGNTAVGAVRFRQCFPKAKIIHHHNS